MNDPEARLIVTAAAQVLAGAALDVLQDDPHSWSTRPCVTCRTVSSLVGRPFGCNKFRADRVASEAPR